MRKNNKREEAAVEETEEEEALVTWHWARAQDTPLDKVLGQACSAITREMERRVKEIEERLEHVR